MCTFSLYVKQKSTQPMFVIQIGLYKHRRWSEAVKFGFRLQMNCTISIAKTKALISVFVFAYADSWFSHEVAQLVQ